MTGKGQKEVFRDVGNVCYLDRSEDCMDVCFCQNSSNGSFKTCAFFFLQIVSQFRKMKSMKK